MDATWVSEGNWLLARNAHDVPIGAWWLENPRWGAILAPIFNAMPELANGVLATGRSQAPLAPNKGAP